MGDSREESESSEQSVMLSDIGKGESKWRRFLCCRCFAPFKKLRRIFFTAKGFLVCFSMYIFFQSMVSSGYTAGVSTSIEQRYSLRSSEIGTIISAGDIGSLSTVVFVSWFGGSGNRPRWVAGGGFLVVLGSLLFTLPQLISGLYQPSGSDPNSIDGDLCQSNYSVFNPDDCLNVGPKNSLYMFIFLLANLIIGMGGSPIYTLGTTYVHDAAPVRSAPVYVSVVYLVGAIGPAAGYVLASQVENRWVDPFQEPSVSPADTRWVGQWWLGYFIAAVFVFLSLLPMFLFKKQPPSNIVELNSSENSELNEELINQSTTSSQMSFGNSIKDLPRNLIKQLSNKAFTLVTLTMCCEFTIVVSFLTFMPKYLQEQFSIDSSISALLCGGVLLPAAGLGIVLGGYLIRRFDLDMVGCAKMATFTSILSICLIIPVFFLKCGSAPIAGVTIDYPTESDTISDHGELPLAECNQNCDCSGVYQPLCYEHVTFVNPCLAGCQMSVNGSFADCACLGNPAAPSIPTGACEKDCFHMMAPFLVFVFVVTCVTASAQTPAIMITLRCCADDERPLAMGVQFLIMRLLAYIPAPMYFGAAIDMACILWDNTASECDDDTGACAIYSPDIFRYIYFGLTIGVKLLAFLLAAALWRELFRRKKCSENGSLHESTSLPTSDSIVTPTAAS
ncbi:Oidioi.mRNA.OKI2018_I69.chr2.g4091.t1.cds [Oikopleura dioica]|uniref:Solute carrier organic anion transporter family member n=1 Tax=Oikopleura dioica TaxID=34765 RepID=A0ABN7T2W5_OIKDI|nr:Oidioi.mRNA.OKI2018_I69.chr2.g4091.t1.cds [Oikopleura dioica]